MAEWSLQKQAIGDRIRDARGQRGWNTTELSIQADVGLEQISRYENGTRTPSLENLVKIATALELPLSALQPSELDEFGTFSQGEADVLEALRALSPLKRQAACEHIISILQLMKE